MQQQYQRQAQCHLQIGLVCLAFVIAFGTATLADEPRRLTNDGRRKLSPSFINAKELVYVDLERPELTAIKRLQLSDLSVQLLHDKTNAQQLEPSFSPDGGHCVFLKATGTLTVSMVIRDEKENTEVLFPPGRGFCGFRSPRFSPNGKRVIYSYADTSRPTANGFCSVRRATAIMKSTQ